MNDIKLDRSEAEQDLGGAYRVGPELWQAHLSNGEQGKLYRKFNRKSPKAGVQASPIIDRN